MSKAFRDDQGSIVVRAQHFSMPPQKGEGVSTQIHRNIEDLAAQATHNFCFSEWSVLEVHATHRPTLSGLAKIDLRNLSVADQRLQLLLAK